MDNKAFLGKLFPSIPLSQVWVGWNDGIGQGFPGGPADKYLDQLELHPDAGHYFCIGSLKPGHTQRRLQDIEYIRALVLDDIGTKARLDRVRELLARTGQLPSWAIETSAGNFQVGWTYNRPLGPSEWTMHRMAVMFFHKEFGVDKAGADPNRLVRLPSGANLKAGKQMFRARLVDIEEVSNAVH